MSGIKVISALVVLKNHPLFQLFKFGYHHNSRMLIVPILNGLVSTVHRFYSVESKPSISELQTCHVTVNSLVEVAQHLGLNTEEFNHAISESPDILKASPSQLEKCFSQLTGNGFSPQDCLKMITVYPDLLFVTPKRVSLSLEHWRNSQLGDSCVLSLIRRCPHFLCIELSEIPRRIPLLQSLSSKRNVTNLLKNSPNLMLESWSKIEAKMDYLENVMKVDRKQIIKTFALNRTLITIKTRHVFLERCGKYDVPKRKVDPDQPSKNPPLSSIIDTSDMSFATRVAGVTLEEFEVFQELYSRELQKAEDEDNSESDGE